MKFISEFINRTPENLTEDEQNTFRRSTIKTIGCFGLMAAGGISCIVGLTTNDALLLGGGFGGVAAGEGYILYNAIKMHNLEQQAKTRLQAEALPLEFSPEN